MNESDVYWIVDAETDAVAGTAAGVRFVARRGGAVSDGRYEARAQG